nr:GNAT family N-acetyltransferase [Hydrogenophaga sp. NH-16]
MGALKELTPTTATEGGHGELKSMRTSARHLRQGAAQAILTELLTLARERGVCVRPTHLAHDRS